MSIKQTITDMLVDKFDIPAEEITEDATFEDLDLDSLDIAELAMAVEDDLGIRLNEDEMGDLATVGDVINLLETK